MSSSTDDQVVFLLKFGNEENIFDLFQNGTIFFNTIDYFQNLEEQGLRGDPYEGTFRITNLFEENGILLKIKIPDTRKEVKLFPGNLHLREFYSDIKGNIYSMYAMKFCEIKNASNYTVDKRVKDFGSHFVIIQKPQVFIDKIQEKLDALKIDYRMGMVNYYDRKKINCKIGPFDKPNDYEYQKEFRILLYRDALDSFSIKLGNLKEFAMIFEVKAIDEINVIVIKN